MRNAIVYIWFSIGIVVLVLSIFNFNNGFSNIEIRDNSTDTVLSILVTFLVAWQIWQTLKSSDELKEANNIKIEYEKQLELFKEQDARNTCLIEAFELKRDAQASPPNLKYELYLRSISLFLKARVAPNHGELAKLVADLDTILEQIRKSPQAFVEQFNEKQEVLDNLYDEIVSELKTRTDELRTIRDKIRVAHKTRYNIHMP